METDKQLAALYKLKQSVLGYSDYTDVTAWAERAGPEFDTSKLMQKTRERITWLFNQHFEVR